MEKLTIPSGINIAVKEGAVVVTGSGKTFEIRYSDRVLKVKTENSEVSFSSVGKVTRPKAAVLHTIVAHVKNAFTGISTGFSKKLQVVYSHFPVSIEIKGKEALIKNFLGEKVPRIAKIVGETKVDVKGQDITFSGHDKYDVGQTAINFVVAVKIRQKDRRVFQDGIYPVI